MGPISNIDVTSAGRIEKATKKFAQEKRLEQLKKRNKDSLVEELKKLGVIKLNQDEEFQALSENLTQRVSRNKRLWRKNRQARIKMEIQLGFLLHVIGLVFFLGLTLNFASLDTDDLFRRLLSDPNYDSILPLLWIVTVAVVIWKAQRRSKDSLPRKGLFYSALILISMLFWQNVIFIILTLSEAQLFGFSPQVIALALLPTLSVTYWWYEKKLVASQEHSDRETLEQSDGDNKYIEQQEKEIDELAENILEDVRVTLEEENDLKKQDPYATKVPNYATPRPYRKLGERHDEYTETDFLSGLTEHIDELDRGSFGIAGVRGFGKTSLMKAVARNLENKAPKGFLTVWLSAPTAIDEKTFLLSVLAKLATRVGAKLSGEKFWPNERPDAKLEKEDKYRIKWMRGIWGIAIAGALCILLSVINWNGHKLSVPPYGSFEIELYDLVLLFVVIFGIYFFSLFKRGFGGNRRFTFVDEMNRPLVVASEDLLGELWYERKDTLSSEVSMSQFGVSLGGSSGTEKKRQPFTLPHLIQMWDHYVEHVTNKDLGGFEKIVVFIDEIDKMKDTDEIGKFMRILKALYNPMNLFFVVSISKDAYEDFQTRMSTTKERNEFDSSFDHMLQIKPMEYGETEKLINSRILGYSLPIPCTLLIWMLSKGNPRDAIRFARKVLFNYQDKDIDLVAWNLCLEQLGETFSNRIQSELKANQLNFEALSQLSDLGNASRKHFVNNNPNAEEKKNEIEDMKEKLWKVLEGFNCQKPLPEPNIIKLHILILAELGYELTIYELCCCRSVKESKKIKNNERSLRQIGSVQKCLSDGSGSQALDKLNEFRSGCNLARIELRENRTNVATFDKSTATSL